MGETATIPVYRRAGTGGSLFPIWIPLVPSPILLSYLPNFETGFMARERAAQQMRSLHITCSLLSPVHSVRHCFRICACSLLTRAQRSLSAS